MTGPLHAFQAVKKWPNNYKSLVMAHELASGAAVKLKSKAPGDSQGSPNHTTTTTS